MKKSLVIIVYHLGYGGIEKAVSSLANLLKDEFDISILAFYKLYESPIFSVDSNISITYLYDSAVPLKVKKYNQLLKSKKLGSVFSSLFQDYIKGFHFLSLFHDLFFSIHVYFLGGRFKKLKKYLKNNTADIYLSTRYEISEILSKYEGSILKVGWEHNHHHGNLEYKKKVVEASKNLHNLVLVSKSLLQDYHQEMINDPCKCVYIPNMLDGDLDFKSDYSEKRILMVGRLEEEKGFFDAIEIAKRLSERGIAFHLDIVGDGPLKGALERHIGEKNLASYVQLHGFLKPIEIQELMKHASLYLMTSFTESFGLVLIEAMNASLPCLAFSSAEGARELIFDDYNGYIVLNRDMERMTNLIISLLANPILIQKLGANAKVFSQNYLPEQVKDIWMSLFKGSDLG